MGLPPPSPSLDAIRLLCSGYCSRSAIIVATDDRVGAPLPHPTFQVRGVWGTPPGPRYGAAPPSPSLDAIRLLCSGDGSRSPIIEATDDGAGAPPFPHPTFK